MFLFTAVSHFHPQTRPDLIQMVPPALPEPAALVTATGLRDSHPARVKPKARRGVTEECRRNQPTEGGRGAKKTTRTRSLRAEDEKRRDGGVQVPTTFLRKVVRPARLERATSWFVARRSIQLS